MAVERKSSPLTIGKITDTCSKVYRHSQNPFNESAAYSRERTLREG
jgi:hypothetical protein